MLNNYVSRELANELHGVTGWKPEAWWAKSAYNGEWMIVPDKHYKVHEYHDEPGAGSFYDHSPTYTLGYVIDKTPKRDHSIENTFMLGRNEDNTKWSSVYQDVVCLEELPADSIARLLITLVNQKRLAA